MDISKLKHHANFDLVTNAFGRLRCGPITMTELSKFDQMARAASIEPETLARKLLLTIGRKLTDSDELDAVCGGPSLTEEESSQVSRPELDDFSSQFIVRRLRVTPEDLAKSASDSINPGCDQLAEAFIAHTDSQRARMERILGEAQSSILGGTSLEDARDALTATTRGDTAAELARKFGIGETLADQARKFSVGDSAAELARKFGIGETMADQARKFGVGDSAAELARKFGIGETMAEQARKFGIGETVAEKMRKDALGASALNAAFRTVEASNKLGESIASLRAFEKMASKQPEHIDMARLPPLLPNPILETNRLLERQQIYAEEMRPTVIRCAELIQTLTDSTLAMQAFSNNNSAQAEKHARRSMRVAIGSIAIAVITSVISIYYAMLSPTGDQFDKLTKTLATQTDAANAAAKEERAATALREKEDRAAFVAAIMRSQKLKATESR